MKISRNGLLACAALALSVAGFAPAKAETVRVTVSYYSAATGPYFEKMAAEFHKQNPGTDAKIDVKTFFILQLARLRVRH